MLDIELRRKIDALWDKFWSGGLANPLTAIDQINYLIFLNRLEATDNLEARTRQVIDIVLLVDFATLAEDFEQRVRKEAEAWGSNKRGSGRSRTAAAMQYQSTRRPR